MSDPAPKAGLLLINLGTPEAPTESAVRTYLEEFLSDPRVLTMSSLGRWALLNLIILPRRPKESAEAYAKIWTDEGSPLMTASVSLTEKVRAKFEAREQAGHAPVRVELAMRYGQPSIESTLKKMWHDGVDRVVVFPLYPQYASASTGSVIEECNRVAKELWTVPSLSFVPPFFDEDAWIQPQAELAKQAFADFDGDHYLFSFHGIPESHVTRGDPVGDRCRINADCCASVNASNRLCYRAHCYATARALAKTLELDDDAWSVAFQSRLTKEPWLKPYTDLVVPELAQKGKKRLVMFSPAFVADCLETLEELGLRAKEDFEAAGGEAFCLVPCVNDDDAWVDGVVELSTRAVLA